MLRVIKKIFQLKPSQLFLLMEAFSGIVFSKVVLLFFSFKKIAPNLGSNKLELNKELSPLQLKKAEEIRLAVARASRFIPLRSVCIDQAMTGLSMLSRRKIPAGICLGVKKDLNENKLLAHAWVVCGNRILIGGKQSRGFKLVSTFVKNHP